jgi:16S rRNA (cytidine1402-2'-O)-methyltransferase
VRQRDTGSAQTSATPEPAGADAAATAEPAGVLVLAGTPIGNLGDVSHRLAEELSTAQIIAAEDTRRLRRLLDRLGIANPARQVVSYFEGNEQARTPQLLAELTGGARVLLITDAGMPSISDPGYRLVAAAIEAGVPVTAVPGPSAVLTAVGLSGLPADRFCFEGFLPRRRAERRSRLGELAAEPRTLVFFEAPHRTAQTLADLVAVFGDDRRAAVCRELTKLHEEIRRGRLADLAGWAAGGIRGEVTLVVSGALFAPEAASADVHAAALADIAELTDGGMRLKPAVAFAARRHDLAKNTLYDAALANRAG